MHKFLSTNRYFDRTTFIADFSGKSGLKIYLHDVTSKICYEN